ncbi:MAG: MGMT family protein [Gammaproteobacteria bacterium]|nr:MGMT family protein [Gammaproteobacteria bacterium]
MTSYATIYHWVRRVPEGKVATYGQIAGLAGKCSARQVGYAMAALPDGSGIPWHRIINGQGKISLRTGSEGHHLQRILLEAEGIVFSADDTIDLIIYRWTAPTEFQLPKT